MFAEQARKDLDYKLSSALADLLYSSTFGKEKIDGLIYPSVQHQGGWNFAILAESARAKLMVIECEQIQILKPLGYGLYQFKQLAVSKSISDDNKINWKVADWMIPHIDKEAIKDWPENVLRDFGLYDI